jgi:diacylglycerol kinase (ATP)
MKNLLFIINPIAGTRSKKDLPELIGKNLSKDFTFKILNTERAQHATEIALTERDNFDAVIAVGGDGTINEVAKGLIGSTTPMGVIPMGSGNGLARHMKLPLNIGLAIEVFNSFNIQAIDTCKVNNESFLITSGVGFEARIGHLFAQQKGRGFSNYVRAIINSIKGYQSGYYEIEIDGKKIDTQAFTVSVANANQYGNNAFISPLSDIQDGLMNLCIIRPFPKAMAVGVSTKLLTKRIHKSKYYESYLAKKITITSKNGNQYHIDGEPESNKKGALHYEILPLSLNLLVN